MTGLTLSEHYYAQYGAPLLASHFSEVMPRIAAGLVGEGSECFGFDDDLSHDHDWGSAFCLWLEEDDLLHLGPRIREVLASLPSAVDGIPARSRAMAQGERVGALGTGRFYRHFTGLDRPPLHPREWLRIPEQALAACTNGRVFTDPLGTFTRFRTTLLDHYPEPVRLRKLEARCEGLAQSGQYNLLRCLHRGELVAARLAEAEFVRHAIAAAHLLARRYCPFYKWMHRSLLNLPSPWPDLHHLLKRFVQHPGVGLSETRDAVEEICSLLIHELRAQNLTHTRDGFLLAHAQELQTQ